MWEHKACDEKCCSSCRQLLMWSAHAEIQHFSKDANMYSNLYAICECDSYTCVTASACVSKCSWVLAKVCQARSKPIYCIAKLGHDTTCCVYERHHNSTSQYLLITRDSVTPE